MSRAQSAITSWVAAGVLVLAVRAVRGRTPAAVWMVAAALALLVAASRLALGVHYPSDVLGAWLAGTAWVAVTAWLVLVPGRTRPRAVSRPR